MALSVYENGTLVTLRAEFTVGGVDTDPSDVILTITDPAGVVTTYTFLLGQVIRDGTGKYHYNLTVNQSGLWKEAWAGTGPASAVKTSAIVVQAPVFWTYSGNPADSSLDEVRFLIADTDQTKPWTLQNPEIQYAIMLHSDSPPIVGRNFLAAAVCAETILGKFKIIAQSKSVGDLSISYGNHFTFYQNLANQLRNRAALMTVKPYVGGTSRTEKQRVDADKDRVQPAVKVDGMDYAATANPNDPRP